MLLKCADGVCVAVVGLGYVGLPLAVAFGEKYRTIGYDLSEVKISHYRAGVDPTGEVSSEDMKRSEFLEFSSSPEILRFADVVIVAVPTPVDACNVPDFTPLVESSKTVGRYLKAGATVVYESTVYPGATEEICIPLLERESGLVWKQEFHVGYSPERVNPGDKERGLCQIIKIVSGDSPDTLDFLSDLYGSIITAGVHRAASIKVAEAAKVIENTQRDLNIALVNELAIIFDRIGIDTLDVLEAAGTKWNFLPFRPGLVGGHCIGVDPYYLTYKAEMLGYHPQVVLAGRRINSGMPSYVAKKTVQAMVRQGGCRKGDVVIVLGMTFKENCPDIRNSKVVDLIENLRGFGLRVVLHDPVADPEEVIHEYGLSLTSWDELPRNVPAVIAAVSHRAYRDKPISEILTLLKPGGMFMDVKSVYPREEIEKSGFSVWRL